MSKRNAVFAALFLVLVAASALADEVEIMVLEESDQGLYGAVLRAGGNANVVPLVMDDNGISQNELTELIPGREIAIQKRYLEPDFKPSRAILARARAIFSGEAVAIATKVVPEKITAVPPVQHEPIVVRSVPAPSDIPSVSTNPPIVPKTPRLTVSLRRRALQDSPVDKNQGPMMFMGSMMIFSGLGCCAVFGSLGWSPISAWRSKKAGVISIT